MKYVGPQRRHGGDQAVQPHVEFAIVYEQWACDVSLHHALELGVDVTDIASEEDSLTTKDSDHSPCFSKGYNDVSISLCVELPTSTSTA